MKKIIKKIPILGPLAVKFNRKLSNKPKFTTSGDYWSDRYGTGGNSGVGSYNELAEYKGEIINNFLTEKNIFSVIEHGCGDGNQIKYCNYKEFLGYEISEDALDSCKKLHQGDQHKEFRHFNDYKKQKFDLSISLDVIYCVVEPELYEQYMSRLFDSASKYVLAFSTDTNKNNHHGAYIKHRKFTDWVEKNRPEFTQINFIKNKYSGQIKPFVSDFYFFERK